MCVLDKNTQKKAVSRQLIGSFQQDGILNRAAWSPPLKSERRDALSVATLLATLFHLLWRNTRVWKEEEREAAGARRAAGLSVSADPWGSSPHAAHLWGFDRENIQSCGAECLVNVKGSEVAEWAT